MIQSDMTCTSKRNVSWDLFELLPAKNSLPTYPSKTYSISVNRYVFLDYLSLYVISGWFRLPNCLQILWEVVKIQYELRKKYVSSVNSNTEKQSF